MMPGNGFPRAFQRLQFHDALGDGPLQVPLTEHVIKDRVPEFGNPGFDIFGHYATPITGDTCTRSARGNDTVPARVSSHRCILAGMRCSSGKPARKKSFWVCHCWETFLSFWGNSCTVVDTNGLMCGPVNPLSSGMVSISHQLHDDCPV